MIQNIDKPARTIEHEIETMNFNIKDSHDVICNVDIEVRDGGRSRLKAVVQVNTLIADAIAAGDITSANATGFKKCMKLICSQALGIALAETNDPL